MLTKFRFPSIAALPYGDDNNDIYSNIDYEDAASSDGGGGRENSAEKGRKILTYMTST